MNHVIYEVAVAVATVWTDSNSPRPIDFLALDNPVNVQEWLRSMSFEERLALSNYGLIQSQLLYGEKVVVLEEKNGWVKVAIPNQPSSKNEQGYPGWVPRRQLNIVSKDAILHNNNITIVTPTAFLFNENGSPFLEVSYLTSLQLITEADNWYFVKTPHGPKRVKKHEAIVGFLPPSRERVIKEAEKFLGLDYLWGGMTGFGFDCSGFSHSMLRVFGKNISRDASDQVKEGLEVTMQDVAPGDLLFFAYEKGKGRVHHVGIYYGNGQMIHAPKTGKQIETIPITNNIYEEELCAIKRFIV